MKRHTTDNLIRFAHLSLMAIVLLSVTQPVRALTRIRDIARPLGERTNRLWATSLVVGLNGTGDGSDISVTSRSLAGMLQNLGDQTVAEELRNVKNVALVYVTAELGRNGFRDGDVIDVQVASLGNAQDLTGGRLIPTPLQGYDRADDRLYAWAQGPIIIPDKDQPTTGVIKGGAVLESDFLFDYIYYDEKGQPFFTLVIDEDQASLQTSKQIAMIIEDELMAPGEKLGLVPPIAIPLDGKNIQVMVPSQLAKNPTRYMARVMNMQVELPEPEACVWINERTGTIGFTANVEIAPVVVHVDGMSIRIINPEPVPTPEQPVVTQSQWGRFDTRDNSGVKIDQLITALDQLSVPVEGKINAIYALQSMGALRARLITDR